ncbi:hypothetical protein J6590_026454 [Homalodisca vitripennis]|nr:hypothetical protein J6590_026454 [Homalodisca vitripennis]
MPHWSMLGTLRIFNNKRPVVKTSISCPRHSAVVDIPYLYCNGFKTHSAKPACAPPPIVLPRARQTCAGNNRGHICTPLPLSPDFMRSGEREASPDCGNGTLCRMLGPPPIEIYEEELGIKALISKSSGCGNRSLCRMLRCFRSDRIFRKGKVRRYGPPPIEICEEELGIRALHLKGTNLKVMTTRKKGRPALNQHLQSK